MKVFVELIKDTVIAIKCFFDWPMLWTRIYCTAALIFIGYQLNYIAEKNSDSVLHRSLADGYQWLGMLIIAFYVAPKVFDVIMAAFVQMRTGQKVSIPDTQSIKETNVPVKETQISNNPPAA